MAIDIYNLKIFKTFLDRFVGRYRLTVGLGLLLRPVVHFEISLVQLLKPLVDFFRPVVDLLQDRFWAFIDRFSCFIGIF